MEELCNHRFCKSAQNLYDFIMEENLTEEELAVRSSDGELDLDLTPCLQVGFHYPA